MKENISEKQPVQSSEITEKAVKVNESAAEKQAEKQSVKSADITVNNSNKITKDQIIILCISYDLANP